MADPRIVTLPGPIPSATVEVVDDMPPDPAPWWKDPLKLGAAVLGGVLVLLLLTKE